jgi:hypothetical protein
MDKPLRQHLEQKKLPRLGLADTFPRKDPDTLLELMQKDEDATDAINAVLTMAIEGTWVSNWECALATILESRAQAIIIQKGL